MYLTCYPRTSDVRTVSLFIRQVCSIIYTIESKEPVSSPNTKSKISIPYIDERVRKSLFDSTIFKDDEKCFSHES